MGRYLYFGIAKQVVLNYKWPEGKYSAQDIIDLFFSKVDKKIFDTEIDEKNGLVYFNLKEDLLLKHGIDLIKEQFEKYIELDNYNDFIEYFEYLKEQPDEEILKVLESGHEECFRILEFEKLYSNTDLFLGRGICGYVTKLVSYFYAEKPLFAIYGSLAHYTKNLLVNSTDNPLKTALTIVL